MLVCFNWWCEFGGLGGVGGGELIYCLLLVLGGDVVGVCGVGWLVDFG